MATTIARAPAPAHQPTRRALLAGAAAAPALALPAVALAAPEVDPHVAWAAEVARLRPIMDAAKADLGDALAGEICELNCLIIDTPARTVAGVREQVRVLHHLLDAKEGDTLEAV